MRRTHLSACRPVWWVAPWVALVAASIALAYTFNSEFVGNERLITGQYGWSDADVETVLEVDRAAERRRCWRPHQ
jgi:hypothetical protein